MRMGCDGLGERRRDTGNKGGRSEEETFHGSNPPVECDAVLWLGMRGTGRSIGPHLSKVKQTRLG
jgi:hypothetical protein